MLPGLDVVVFSNGADWVKGWRNAVLAAQAGRIVMIVDSTDLLNKRHIGEKDSGMLAPYPLKEGKDSDILGFDAIIRHPHGLLDNNTENNAATTTGSTDNQPYKDDEIDDVTIVTYGTGVIIARQTQMKLVNEGYKVGILEIPCISETPSYLNDYIKLKSKTILFADPCKRKQAPLLNFIVDLQEIDNDNNDSEDSSTCFSNKEWKFVSAANTYNPLGSTITFLNEEDVTNNARKLAQSSQLQK